MTGWFLGLTLDHRFGEGYHAAVKREPGSEQIASAFALTVLEALLARLKPTRVLEIGSGIGTMTRLLVRACQELHVAEDNPWCLSEMTRKLSERERRLKLVPGLGHLLDLIVVDGDQVRPQAALERLRTGGWILVEGNRRPWRAQLPAGHRRFAAVNLRPADRSKGVWLLAFEPSRGLRLAFALERAWQAVLEVTARLRGRSFHGKRKEVLC